MIKIILWDLDNTLLDFKKSEKAAIVATFKAMNLGECTTKMLNRYSKIDKEYWLKIETKKISKEEALIKRYEDFLSEYGIDKNLAKEFNENYAIALSNTIIYNEKSLDVLTTLKEKYKQYIVSNGVSKIQHTRLNKSGIDKIVDGVFISDEIGYEKPDREFFEYVLSHIEYDNKSEIMIVGDSLTSDIKGGSNIGINTCWYNPKKKDYPFSYKVDLDIHSLQELIEILNYIS